MKRIGYSQRVEVVESYGERRDCADQNIPRFLHACGFLPVPIMNVAGLAQSLCEELALDGIVFTGGNDLADYGGNAPERDETERRLLEYAVEKGIPVLGICRGMQFIAHYYGAGLQKVENHIRKNHHISGKINRKSVNSFHGMSTVDVHLPLEVLAVSEDGMTEAVCHREKAVAGIMWHPEREASFSQEDIDMIAGFFEGGELV